MDCVHIRDALSARLDNEAEGHDPHEVDRHLRSCVACRSWWAESGRLHRAMRLTEAPPVPDLSDRVLATVRPRRRGRHRAVRVALGVVSLAQTCLGLAQLLGLDVAHGMHSGAGAAHLGNESAAWNLAVGIGLFWTAIRPHSAGGLLPALAPFAAVLGVVSAVDLHGGTVGVGRVLSHGILLAGLCLLFVVHRQSRTRGPAPTSGTTAPDPGVGADTAAQRWEHVRPITSAQGDRPRRLPFARRR
ncbi:zf-HC2 domain-containing protein, partial [Saccharomonospora halophila]|uniref:zf-HC2 domain-containing protein n=1 Tax=Saccharomonospora halophila TaxID=129922 RepID=UPI00036E6A00